jgi:hypothetical protein
LAQNTLSTQFEVESIQFIENEGEQSIAITIKNNGDFFNYPIIQVKIGDTFIANEEAKFTTYGIIDKDTYVFPTDYKATEKVTFTILVIDGAFQNKHKLEHKFNPE